MKLRKLGDFKGLNILTDCPDISKKGIEARIQKELDNPYDTSEYRFLSSMYLFINMMKLSEWIGEKIGFYKRGRRDQLTFV